MKRQGVFPNFPPHLVDGMLVHRKVTSNIKFVSINFPLSSESTNHEAIVRRSLHMSLVAHKTRAYPGFLNMKWLRVFPFLPGWDASPLQGYPPLPSIKFASTHLYTWVENGTVRVHCLAQEHNTMFLARATVVSPFFTDRAAINEKGSGPCTV